MIIIWNGILKARYYNFAPLAIWRKLLHTSNLCQKYASANGLFSGSRCQIFTTLGEDYTPPRSSPSRSLRSLTVLLGGPLTRIFESPEKFLVTGLHTHAFRLFAMSDVAQCWTVIEHRIYIRSTSNPSFFPRSRFENLNNQSGKFRFDERSTTHKELQHNGRKKSHNSQEFIKDNRRSYSWNRNSS